MQEDVKNGKSPWRRRFFWLAVILVAGSYFSWGKTHEFDLNSGRTRYTFTLYAIPLYWKTSETEFSRLLETEGITTGDEPPLWVLDRSHNWMFRHRSPHCRYHGIIHDAKTFCIVLKMLQAQTPEIEIRPFIQQEYQRLKTYRDHGPRISAAEELWNERVSRGKEE